MVKLNSYITASNIYRMHRIKGYTITLYIYSNRSGFVHYVIINKDSQDIARAKVQYINRTWEKSTGRTAYAAALLQAREDNQMNREDYTRIYQMLQL